MFRDTTGRPGPATWVQGEYPRGQEDFPVAGVSWYEAAAYAEWAGKALPTIYHWATAASPWASASILPASNFGGQGPARVGSFPRHELVWGLRYGWQCKGVVLERGRSREALHSGRCLG